ncbi:MAG: hypothetical protein ABL973_14255 [Micropepsaceae bacterium]
MFDLKSKRDKLFANATQRGFSNGNVPEIEAPLPVAYARQAKNRNLEADAAEIRIRAERRLGEMLTDQKKTVGLNQGASGGGKKSGSRGTLIEPRDTRPTLSDAGIDKKLSSRSQQLAAKPAFEFEKTVADVRRKVETADLTSGGP